MSKEKFYVYVSRDNPTIMFSRELIDDRDWELFKMDNDVERAVSTLPGGAIIDNRLENDICMNCHTII